MKLNTNPLRRKRELRRQVRSVLFGPFDLPVVIGDPSKRRDLMDEAVVALWPLKDGLSTAYERALRQRNRLLKEWEGGRGGPSGMEAWDEELIRTGVPAGGGARRSRRAPRHGGLGGVRGSRRVRPRGRVRAERVVRRGVEEAFRAQLASRRPDELVRRTSLVGPHRDDLTLAVRDLGARAFGSHGETWAAALCLRLGIAAAVAEEAGEQPRCSSTTRSARSIHATRPDRGAAGGARRSGGDRVADEADVPSASSATWDVANGSVTVRS